MNLTLEVRYYAEFLNVSNGLSQTFQRQNLIIFILDPKYSFELNQKVSDIYMNRSAIDEENQIEIFGVYHLDPWETFVESIKKYTDNRTGLEEFIKDRTDSQSNHKQIIAEAIERYARETNMLKDHEPSLLHIIWAGDLGGNGRLIQPDQFLFHFIQFELDRYKIKQAMFTNIFMFKHNVISHATLEKLYNPETYELPKSINTRPENDPIMIRITDIEPENQFDTKKFTVNDLTVSIGDDIEDLIFQITAGKLTTDELGRIKREPHHIKYKPSVKEMFHVQKLDSEQSKKLNKDNPDEEYVKSFREGTLYHSAKNSGDKIFFIREGQFKYPDVPEKEMKIVKEKFDSTSKYALSCCTRRTLLLVGSAKIPPCYF